MAINCGDFNQASSGIRLCMIFNIFIQARMSSSRFPGKILAPLRNKPLIKHIIDCAKQVSHINKVVVLTSLEESDDPVASYLEKINCDYFRGSLENVFYRFQETLKVFPCDYLVRLSADSPFLDNNLINFMIKKMKNENYDIISNVIVKKFPKGQSVEIIKAQTFLDIDKARLTKEECEHVFPYFYRNIDKYKVLSVENDVDESSLNMCVDTLQDLERLSSCKPLYQFCQSSHVE